MPWSAGQPVARIATTPVLRVPTTHYEYSTVFCTVRVQYEYSILNSIFYLVRFCSSKSCKKYSTVALQYSTVQFKFVCNTLQYSTVLVL